MTFRLPRAVLLLVLVPLGLGGCRKEPQLTTSSPEAARAYGQGLAQYEKFYYNDAKALFDQAVRADSNFAMAWARLAIVEMRVKNEPQARADIARALRASAHATEPERLFIRMWDERLRFDPGAAAATADSLAALYPDQKEVYLFRGDLYEEQKNFDAAIRSYQRAIQADTGYALAVMTLGYAYSTIGEQDRAIAMMKRYIRLAPQEPDPLASYADILMRAGEFDEALKAYQQSLAVKPDYWYSIQKIGEIYAIQGRLNDAERQFQQSYALVPQNRALEAAKLQIDANLESLRGRDAEAVQLYQKALAVDTVSLEAAYGLARALSRLQRHQEAHAIVDAVLREFQRRELHRSPAMASYYYIRSVVLMGEGKLDAALLACDSAFNYSPALSRGHIYRQFAEICLRKRAFEQALDACEEGLAASPNSPEILLTLTRIYAAKGDRKMTAEIGHRLLRLWKNADPDYRYKREVSRLVGHAT